MRILLRNKADKSVVDQITNELCINNVAAEILVARGIDSAAKAKEFLEPSLSQLNDPMLFDNMQLAVQRLKNAANEKITIFADYDADGVCGAAILYDLIKNMCKEVSVYIPNRFSEGYGMNMEAAKKICESGTSLVISVDCGITNVSETEHFKQNGIDVIILDHHEPGAVLPDTPYIIDAKVKGENYPFKHLCGAGTAFKFACAVIGEKAYKYLPIAAVATIGDIVSLTGENRAIAAIGLERIKKGEHLGISQLAVLCGLKPEKLTSIDVAYTLVPRLNAAGRVESAYPAFELMSTDSLIKAMECAEMLISFNHRRKYLQKKVSDEVEACVRKNDRLCDSRMLMVYGEGFEEGVIGIAAASATEKFYRPCAVMRLDGDILKGSARSIPGVNIFDAFSSCREHFIKFGGHAQAAGFSLKKDKLPELKYALEKYMAELDDELFIPTVEYDHQIRPDDINISMLSDISMLEPFGEGNPSPVFLFKGVRAADYRRIGRDSAHAKFRIADKSSAVNAVMFNTRDNFTDFFGDIIGDISINDYDGLPQVIVKKVSPECVISKNSPEYLRSLISEICGFHKFVNSFESGLSADEFKSSIAMAANESPLGTVVIANSEQGLNAAASVGIGSVMQSRSIAIPKDSAENTLCLTARGSENLSNYNNVFLCGAFALWKPGSKVLATDGLIKAYIDAAKIAFVSSDKMYPLINAVYNVVDARDEYDTVTQFIDYVERETMNFNRKQIWFCLNVFAQHKLIEIKNSGRIHIKINKITVDLAKSSIYRAFEDVIQKGFVR